MGEALDGVRPDGDLTSLKPASSTSTPKRGRKFGGAITAKAWRLDGFGRDPPPDSGRDSA